MTQSYIVAAPDGNSKELPITFQKNPRAHKNKVGTPPPKTQNTPCRTDAFFPGVHKIGAAISGPRIADKNFTDTRIFLNIAIITVPVLNGCGTKVQTPAHCDLIWK